MVNIHKLTNVTTPEYNVFHTHAHTNVRQIDTNLPLLNNVCARYTLPHCMLVTTNCIHSFDKPVDIAPAID